MVKETKDTLDKLSLFSEAFRQTKETKTQKRFSAGKFASIITTVLESFEIKLQQIKPDLPGGVLKPINDMGFDNFKTYSALSQEERTQIDNIRNKRGEELTQLTEITLEPAIKPQRIDIGVLETPDNYHKQGNKRTCMTANFRMIFQEITGMDIEESVLLDAAKNQGLIENGQLEGEYIEDDILYGLLKTDILKKEFPGLDVAVLNTWGTDFDDIKVIMNSVRTRLPNAKFFFRTSISSEVVQNGWHDVIVLSVDEETVTVHDPSPTVGGAFKVIPKSEFIRRWAKTFLSGTLIIVNKRD